MDAKEFLLQIKKLDKLIENKLAEAEQWRAIANSTTTNMSAEKVASSPNPHRTADAICKYMDLEEETRRCVDDLIAAKKNVLSVIEQLNATEYDVLHKLYVQGYTLQDVASLYDHAYTWVTTVHGRALKSVQKILDQKGMSCETIKQRKK